MLDFIVAGEFLEFFSWPSSSAVFTAFFPQVLALFSISAIAAFMSP
jgi:hypothetical protein